MGQEQKVFTPYIIWDEESISLFYSLGPIWKLYFLKSQFIIPKFIVC
jgi:hypothetical protein